MLGELGRHGIKITALQETKWYADAEYRVGKNVVLTVHVLADQRQNQRSTDRREQLLP